MSFPDERLFLVFNNFYFQFMQSVYLDNVHLCGFLTFSISFFITGLFSLAFAREGINILLLSI